MLTGLFGLLALLNPSVPVIGAPVTGALGTVTGAAAATTVIGAIGAVPTVAARKSTSLILNAFWMC